MKEGPQMLCNHPVKANVAFSFKQIEFDRALSPEKEPSSRLTLLKLNYFDRVSMKSLDHNLESCQAEHEVEMLSFLLEEAHQFSA